MLKERIQIKQMEQWELQQQQQQQQQQIYSRLN